jgi:hypothetical protein
MQPQAEAQQQDGQQEDMGDGLAAVTGESPLCNGWKSQAGPEQSGTSSITQERVLVCRVCATKG